MIWAHCGGAGCACGNEHRNEQHEAADAFHANAAKRLRFQIAEDGARRGHQHLVTCATPLRAGRSS
jgi:hypothetical protein